MSTNVCLTCFSSCYKTTIPSSTTEGIYRRTHSEWGVNENVQWWFLDNDVWNEILDVTDLAYLNALDDTSKVSCDAIGGSGGGCTPKIKSETVTIGCNNVVGVTDNADGTYTWTHGLGLLEPTNVMFSGTVVSADANSITFASDNCIGDIILSIMSLGVSDCTPTQGGGGSVTVDAANLLHIDPTTGKVYLGGTAVEDTTLDILNKLLLIKGDDADLSDPDNPIDANQSFTKELNYDAFVSFWDNLSLERSLTITERAQVFSVLSQMAGASSTFRVIGEGVRMTLNGTASFEVSNQGGRYVWSNVPFDTFQQNEFDLVIDGLGVIRKTTGARQQDGIICFTTDNAPNNFIYSLANTKQPIDQATIDELAGGTATDYLSQNDYASFSNTNHTTPAYLYQYPYIKSSASVLDGVLSGTGLQTLYMPNLTSITDPACFDALIDETLTVIIPAAMHTDPAIVSLISRNAVNVLDSGLLSGGLNFKKVIQNRSIRYFDAAGVEVTDAVTISNYENYIRSFAVFITTCGGVLADNGLHEHSGVVHLGGTLIENTTINKDDTTSLHIIHSSEGGAIYTDTYWDSDGTLYTECFDDNNNANSRYQQSGGIIDLSVNNNLCYFGLNAGAKFAIIGYNVPQGYKLKINNLGGVSVNRLGMTLVMLDTADGECDWRIPQYPRVTRAERLGITTTDVSQMVFQTDGSQIGLHYWDGTQWNYIPSTASI